MKTKSIIGIIVVILLAIGGWFMIKHNPVKTLPTLNDAYADSIKKEWDAEAEQWEFSRLQYEATEKQLKQFLKDKDAELYALANKKEVRDVTKIEAIIKHDTIVETITMDSTRYATIKDEWTEEHITSRPDSTYRSLQIRMPLTILKGTDGRITVATPVPYVDIVDLRGFTKVDPVRKKNWKYIVGGVVGGVLVYGVVK